MSSATLKSVDYVGLFERQCVILGSAHRDPGGRKADADEVLLCRQKRCRHETGEKDEQLFIGNKGCELGAFGSLRLFIKERDAGITVGYESTIKSVSFLYKSISSTKYAGCNRQG